MKKVIVFNAPPNAGKDVAAAHSVEKLNRIGYNAHHKEVKENLFKATKACFGIKDETWDKLYTRERKEQETPYLVSNSKYISPRQAMINTSENVLKPLFGKDVFGIMAVNSLEEGINVFSDGGFPEEIGCLREEAGSDNFLLIHLTREGCSFEGDSRNYVGGVKGTITIHNDGTEEEFLDCVYETITEWLEQ